MAVAQAEVSATASFVPDLCVCLAMSASHPELQDIWTTIFKVVADDIRGKSRKIAELLQARADLD